MYYDTTKVKNLYEEEVTESQILGRSLMKTFTAAAAFARHKYGVCFLNILRGDIFHKKKNMFLRLE